jgi:hypothetical protein
LPAFRSAGRSLEINGRVAAYAVDNAVRKLARLLDARTVAHVDQVEFEGGAAAVEDQDLHIIS